MITSLNSFGVPIITNKLNFCIALSTAHHDVSSTFVFRITTVLACQMNFREFPMDQQTCHFYVGCCEYKICQLSLE